MTELEKIERAKMYIDELANGVNPISGGTVPEQDSINNVRISRCFFFISGILQKVIDNGGVISKKTIVRKEKRIPFILSENQKNSFQFSHEPIPISIFTQQINSLINTDEMSSLKYYSITNWLVSIGMLELANHTGSGFKKIENSHWKGNCRWNSQ